MIQDSGERIEFNTGAVRDIREGKGRCDLLPLQIIAKLLDSPYIKSIANYIDTLNEEWLYDALNYASSTVFPELPSMIIEISIHFEEGARKYGERNWQKGIPVHCYVDSAVRHYLKWIRGDMDERHDRATCWNILCAIWTIQNHPELIDIKVAEKEET